MNSEKIIQMIKPYVTGNQLTYDDFDKIFYMLPQREKYLVVDLIEMHLKISLVDEIETTGDDDKKFVEYVLNKISGCVENHQLTYDEFDEIFGDMEKLQQYNVTNILDELNIELVDEKILHEKNFPAESLPLIPRRAEEIKLSNNALVALFQKGDHQAQRDLCVKNCGLVNKYVSKYDKIFSHKIETEDLRQAGMLGLIKAAQKFNFDKETQFSTYATCWIWQMISREVIDTGFIVRLPVHIFEKVKKVRALDIKFYEQGKNISEHFKSIATEMNLSVEYVRYLFALYNAFICIKSLDEPIGEDEDTSRIELLPTENQESIEDIIFKQTLREQIEQVLSKLTERENKVLSLRYGLEDGRERTLEEIGKIFNVTRERIRQIEMAALKKLRHPKLIKKLKDFV